MTYWHWWCTRPPWLPPLPCEWGTSRGQVVMTLVDKESNAQIRVDSPTFHSLRLVGFTFFMYIMYCILGLAHKKGWHTIMHPSMCIIQSSFILPTNPKIWEILFLTIKMPIFIQRAQSAKHGNFPLDYVTVFGICQFHLILSWRQSKTIGLLKSCKWAWHGQMQRSSW